MIQFHLFQVLTHSGLFGLMWRAAVSQEEAARCIIGDVIEAGDYVKSIVYLEASMDPFHIPFTFVPHK